MSVLIFNFDFINNDKTYESNVLIINGRYNIFNNMVCDEVKKRYCTLNVSLSEETMSEFGVEDNSDGRLVADTIEEFMELNKIPSITGKRVCIADYSVLTKKQKEWVFNYIKVPSKVAMLVLVVRDFKDALKFRNSRFVKNEENVNLINLSFPNNKSLKTIIESNLSEYTIEPKALNVFMWRLSNDYEMYAEAFDKVRLSDDKTITYEKMNELLSDIDNYTVEDFMRMLLNPPRNPKGRPRKIYAALRYLLDDKGARYVVNAIHKSATTLIELRMLMNSGELAAGLRFSVNEFKNNLPDESPIKNLSNYAIVKNLNLAKQVSIRDLTVLKLMLENIRAGKYDEFEYERLLYTAINRCTFSEYRVMNDIGMMDCLEGRLIDVNTAHLYETCENTSDAGLYTGV